MHYSFTPSPKPKQKCPHCGAMKVGLADHIKAKHPTLFSTVAGSYPVPRRHRPPPRLKPPLLFEKLDCPDCGAPMRHRDGIYGLYYACSEYKTTGCKGSHGARPDGSPKGIPGDARTRKMRIAAHRVLDPLWKGEDPKFDSQSEAYAWMANVMGMSHDEAHIARFSSDDCKQLVDHVWVAFGDGT